MSVIAKKAIALFITVLMILPALSFGEGMLGEASLGEAVSMRRSEEEIQKLERPVVHPVAPQVEAAMPAPEAPAPAPAAVMGVSVSSSDPGALTAGKSQAEMTADFVTRLYHVVMNRPADPTGLREWTNALLSGTATAADIVTGMFNSPEYQSMNKTHSQIVTDCYKAMMDRAPDSAGLAAWVKALDIGMTSQAILAGFVGSQEFQALAARYGIKPGTVNLFSARDENYERTYFVYRLYANCLGRNPDVVGQESWCRALSQNATGAQCASGFIFSTELNSYHLNNEEFVWMLYETILGRSPGSAELAVWADVLNYSNTRDRVFNGFLFSPEFALQCQVSQINVGSAIPEPDDTPQWQNNIAVLQLVNQYRQAYGLSRLVTRQDLWEEVAMLRAQELVSYFSHTRPDGRECFSALEDVGLDYWYACAENIAAGYENAARVMDGWMNSSGHRANILDEDLKELATGYVYVPNTYYKSYWAQMFTALLW